MSEGSGAVAAFQRPESGLASSASPAAQRRIAHIINSTGVGGAERFLSRLVEWEGPDAALHRVIALADQNDLTPRLEQAGAGVTHLGINSLYHLPVRFGRLSASLGQTAPGLVQGWMYHGNIAAMIARRLAGLTVPVVWNIRHSLDDVSAERRVTRMLIRLGARWSGAASAIIYNARTSAAQHEAIGYDPARTRIIPNGFDTQLLKPDDDARAALNARFSIPSQRILIGQIARAHPQKEHARLIDAIGRLAATGRDVHLLLVGRDADIANPAIARAVQAAGCLDRISFAGQQSDIAGILAGLDILASPSRQEGFPNVIGEAMACAVPVVVTQAGDSAWIAGDTGIIVPVRNTDALAAGLGHIIDEGPESWRRRGIAGRRRIEQQFSRKAIHAAYRALWDEVAAGQ